MRDREATGKKQQTGKKENTDRIQKVAQMKKTEQNQKESRRKIKSEKERQRRYRMSLRLHFSINSVLTLCFSAVIAYILAVAGIWGLYKIGYVEQFTHESVLIVILAVCVGVAVIGGVLLFIQAGNITKPIVTASEAVNQIAEGDFSVRIDRKKKREQNGNLNKRYAFANELDELALNINKMAAELNGMNYMRKDFISNVSHEVKTPVAAIIGLSELLLENKLDPSEQQEYLSLVNQEAMRLSRLCENMLILSKLDHQQIVEKKDRVRVDEQIRKCLIMLSEKWPEKEINYEMYLPSITITSNADLLMQVWTNLLDNAIKYSPNQSTLWIAGNIDEKELTITIRDEGPGIPPEKIDKIFDQFYQCEESHKKQGNGLGLSIVRRILDLLSSTIHCQSSPPYGTTMRLTIPVRSS